MKRIAGKLTYSNVVATAALFAALATGGAYAASKIGAADIARNAVRAKHIKSNQVRATHLAAAAVRPKQLQTGAVRAAKLADGSVEGAKLGDVVARSEALTVNAGQFASRTVACATGEALLSGGADVPASASTVSLIDSHPGFETLPGQDPFQVWNVRARNTGGSAVTVDVWVLCLE